MDIGTATSLSDLLTHILIECRHHRTACIILHVFTSAGNGDRCALCGTNAQHINTHTAILGGLGRLYCPTLMIFTIGNHDYRLSDALFLREAVGSHIYGSSDIGALSRHHRGVDTGEEHLG